MAAAAAVSEGGAGGYGNSQHQGGFGGGGAGDLTGGSHGYGGGAGGSGKYQQIGMLGLYRHFYFGGGGGGGFGADVFVQEGGSLTIGAGVLGAGNVSGGGGGQGYNGAIAQDGGSAATGLFIQGTQTVSLAPASGKTLEVDGEIYDQNGYNGHGGAGSLQVAGAGTVKLTAHNHYTGTTTLSSGTLELGNSQAVPGALIWGAAGASQTILRLDYVNPQASRVDMSISGFGGSDSLIHLPSVSLSLIVFLGYDGQTLQWIGEGGVPASISPICVSPPATGSTRPASSLMRPASASTSCPRRSAPSIHPASL